MRPRTPTHPCPVPGCRRLVSLGLLLCPPHWGAVPGYLKWTIRARRMGRPGEGHKRVRAAYRKAVRAAIEAASAATQAEAAPPNEERNADR